MKKPTFGFNRPFLQRIIAAGLIPAIVDERGNYQPEVAHAWLKKQGWTYMPDHPHAFGCQWRGYNMAYQNGEGSAVSIEIVDSLAQWLIARGWEMGSRAPRLRADGTPSFTWVDACRLPRSSRRWVSLASAVKRELA